LTWPLRIADSFLLTQVLHFTIELALLKEVVKMEQWKCTICEWIYDPAIGDPDSGIAPGTPFEQIPDSWVCPVCGATKDAFVKM
jgi:rubredoxin